ncbi:MAG: acyl-CoA thioesterase [Betaproteobacteria bacterium]|nr:MAG: acyl-CoA thioesterase [Betaproteobacteria bacterium]
MGGAEFQSIVGRFACQVHWGDCDPAGMIFYPTYFRWIDAGSWALFETAGYSPQWMKREHIAMPLVSAQCEFLAPAVHGDRCEVRSRIGRFGGKSFTVEHDIVRSDGTPLAKAQETRVWGRFVGGPGTPLKGETIPEEVKARFRAPSPTR